MIGRLFDMLVTTQSPTKDGAGGSYVMHWNGCGGLILSHLLGTTIKCSIYLLSLLITPSVSIVHRYCFWMLVDIFSIIVAVSVWDLSIKMWFRLYIKSHLKLVKTKWSKEVITSSRVCSSVPSKSATISASDVFLLTKQMLSEGNILVSSISVLSTVPIFRSKYSSKK